MAVTAPETPAAPYRVRSVKNTDARIPGDQFFTDTGTTRIVSIDIASGGTAALTPQPIVLRSFQLSPTGRHILYVAPSPETLGVIGKEQNDTFVLTVPAAGARTGRARKLAERGRFSWAPDGERLASCSGGRLMALPVDGGEPKPWHRDASSWRSASRCGRPTARGSPRSSPIRR